MATTKKTTTQKTASAKKSTAAKPARSVAQSTAKPVRGTAQKAHKDSPHAKAATSHKMQSFHVQPNNPSFTTFKITRQTVYWVILVAFIIFVQLWIIKLQVEVATLIDQQQASLLDN